MKTFFKLFLPFLLLVGFAMETKNRVNSQKTLYSPDKPEKTFFSLVNFYKPKTFRIPSDGEKWQSTWEGKPVEITLVKGVANQFLSLSWEGIPGISPYRVELTLEPKDTGTEIRFQEHYEAIDRKAKLLNFFFFLWEDRSPKLGL